MRRRKQSLTWLVFDLSWAFVTAALILVRGLQGWDYFFLSLCLILALSRLVQIVVYVLRVREGKVD